MTSWTPDLLWICLLGTCSLRLMPSIARSIARWAVINLFIYTVVCPQVSSLHPLATSWSASLTFLCIAPFQNSFWTPVIRYSNTTNGQTTRVVCFQSLLLCQYSSSSLTFTFLFHSSRDTQIFHHQKPSLMLNFSLLSLLISHTLVPHNISFSTIHLYILFFLHTIW